MAFLARPLAAGDLDDIAGWRLAAPFAPPPPAGACHGLAQGDGSLAGFFCWGEAARFPGSARLYGGRPGPLDVFFALSPRLRGRGLGLPAAGHALSWLGRRLSPDAFRAAVPEGDSRALRLCRRLGFLPWTAEGGFLLLLRDERPWREASASLVPGMAVYPGDPPFERSLLSSVGEGGWNVSLLALGAHAGTHVDAPAHVGLRGGPEALPLPALMGAAQLLDWSTPCPEAASCPRILLKNCGRGLTPREAEALLQRGVSLVGVDRLSVGSGETDRQVHCFFLQNHVVLLENAALGPFSPGWYEMRCLPLLIPGCDGAPARLLLREEAPEGWAWGEPASRRDASCPAPREKAP